ncbi:MAG: autorepressor SdpR family transcription factor [Moorellaceae bacterium]
MGLNNIFRALGDPTRREILRLLAGRDLTAGEIALHFDLAKPTISHHLAVLREAGLVLDERRGQHIIYSLNTTVFQDLWSWILELLGSNRREPNGKEA